jgi:hypothetical protein
MRSVLLQFATVCAVYAYYLLPHAQCMLTISYRVRSERFLFVAAWGSVRLQFVNICFECANKLLYGFLQFTLTKHELSGDFLAYTAHTLTIC